MKTKKEPMEIPEEDMALFEAMKGNYVSENERVFFETMRYKEEYELAPANEQIMSGKDNGDGISIIRRYACEYEFGKKGHDGYADSLADALSFNLKTIGIVGYDQTLQEWLRRRDYAGIRYDQNVDLW